MNMNGRNVTMLFTSVSGHLMELDFASSHRNWNACDPFELFTAPVEKTVKEEFSNVAANLEFQARRCSELILWLDCDREGENIGFEVIEVCTRANRNIKVNRARFSSIIPREINNAIRNLGPPNQKDSIAVDTRQEIDLRIGSAWTRWLTQRYRDKYSSFVEHIISYGACQFPTLGFVVERYLERENFKKEKFWAIKLEVKKGNEMAIFNWQRVKLFDKLSCLVLYESCLEGPMVAKILSVELKPKTNFKPLPLTTVALQKQCAKLGISSEKTMEVLFNFFSETVAFSGFMLLS